jgi:hypothetical protein
MCGRSAIVVNSEMARKAKQGAIEMALMAS